MTHRFRCTACGQCCFGQLPLTLDDALANAGLFPLAMIWTPLRKGAKDHASVARLGVTIRVTPKDELAVLIVPTAYIPPDQPCPALGEDRLCSIHSHKPLRCRTMPFYPYREEQFQGEMLSPRKGWQCDVSDAAPIVFHERKVLERADFENERNAILLQKPVIKAYADYMLKYSPFLVADLAKAAMKRQGGQVVSSLSSFLTASRNPQAKQIANLQAQALGRALALTAGVQEYADYAASYGGWKKEMDYLAAR